MDHQRCNAVPGCWQCIRQECAALKQVMNFYKSLEHVKAQPMLKQPRSHIEIKFGKHKLGDRDFIRRPAMHYCYSVVSHSLFGGPWLPPLRTDRTTSTAEQRVPELNDVKTQPMVRDGNPRMHRKIKKCVISCNLSMPQFAVLRQ